MLLELTIHNLAIIDTLCLQAQPGLTVLTGETGAGKSIIIDAIALVLGAKASADVIRTGCEEALVEAVFALEPETRAALAPLLSDLGEAEAEEIILRRDIARSRRSGCRINSRSVPQPILTEVGRHLVNVHGQGEQLSLLQARHQLELVDRFGKLEQARAVLAEQVNALRSVRQELESLNRSERELVQRQDLLTFQVEEIRSAHLKGDEEQTLHEEHQLLANAAKRQQIAAEAYALLSGARQPGILDQVSELVQQLNALGKLDASTVSDSLQTPWVKLNSIAIRAKSARQVLQLIADTFCELRVGNGGCVQFTQGIQLLDELAHLVQDARLPGAAQ